MNNTVLIISNPTDNTTNDVIDWLVYYNTRFLRFNSEDKIDNIKITVGEGKPNISFHLNGQPYQLTDFNSSWYRRGVFKIGSYQSITSIEKVFDTYLKIEDSFLIDSFFKFLKSIKYVNKYHDIFVQKIDVLYQAKSLGIDIPETIITSFKEDLDDKSTYITKPFTDNHLYYIDDKIILQAGANTVEVAIESLPGSFRYSLFQTKLNKKFEIRTFYINRKFYSSAIFSQNDPQTSIDFRNYNYSKPNRIVPFKLPNEIELKLLALLDKLDINSCSIDIVYDENKKFVLLDVNVVGQFEQISYPCNYYLEKILAQTLI